MTFLSLFRHKKQNIILQKMFAILCVYLLTHLENKCQQGSEESIEKNCNLDPFNCYVVKSLLMRTEHTVKSRVLICLV